MHVPFRIHYRNNLIDKKDSYPIPRPPSWDDRNCSYGQQLYPSELCNMFIGEEEKKKKKNVFIDMKIHIWSLYICTKMLQIQEKKCFKVNNFFL